MDRFIKASKTGRRRKPDGNRLSNGTISGYENCFRLLSNFTDSTGISIDICTSLQTNKVGFRKRKQYWSRFYRLFSDYLYSSGYFDNYVSNIFKVIRGFLHYVNIEYGWLDHQFLLHSYARPEKIPVIALSLEQLRFLLFDENLRKILKANQLKVLDIFLFGCITTLRFSDLFRANQKHLIKENEKTWLVMHSLKTGTKSRLLLPPVALTILSKYRLRNGRLLPKISNVNFNIQIKKLGEMAGWTQVLPKFRNKRGVAKPCQERARFCDQLTSHTMRRTGISILLMQGVPEQLVRQISGHKPGSREFFRYINLNQSWQDKQTTAAFTHIL